MGHELSELKDPRGLSVDWRMGWGMACTQVPLAGTECNGGYVRVCDADAGEALVYAQSCSDW